MSVLLHTPHQAFAATCPTGVNHHISCGSGRCRGLRKYCTVRPHDHEGESRSVLLSLVVSAQEMRKEMPEERKIHKEEQMWLERT